MNNILLIISREYLSRVQKKSFIIMTLLTPLLFAGFFFFIGWSATRDADTKTIMVIDESGLFPEVMENTSENVFVYSSESLDAGKEQVKTGDFDGLLFIPKLAIDSPTGVSYFGPNNPSISMIRGLSRKLEGEVENIKLRRSGIDKEVLDALEADIDISTINLSESGEETASSSMGATAVGWISAFSIYMFIFIYGAMCMRGVVEEKTSRIIEVVIASVKPFQLMMGKVIGIAGVGLSQFILWIVLSLGISTIAGSFFADNAMEAQKARTEQMQDMGLPQDEAQQIQSEATESMLSDVTGALESINIPLVLFSFLFFFLGGYLLYGALFAAIGSAVDSDADAQQFMFPVTIPLIIAIASLNGVINDPNGSLAFWLSIIPFTSPVIMMMRVPFGVPMWELGLSMVLMVGGFFFTIWLASRIYRIGILMHGTKVNYKVLGKWIMQKN